MEDRDDITMHLTPDPSAIRVLGRASGHVSTLCGNVAVSWSTNGGAVFALNATVPHNCGRARVVLPVVESLGVAVWLCVNGDRVVEEAVGAEMGAPRLAPDRKSVEVVVSGGRTDLRLESCEV